MLDGRIMGLDIGDKTIGVAVSDIMGITAQGVKTIRRESKKKDIEELKNIIKERQVNKIVSGLPKNMNGTLGPQGEKVLKFCDLIKEETGLDIKDLKLVGVNNNVSPNFNRYLVFLFKTKTFSGELKSSEEGKVFWVEKKNLKNYKLTPEFSDLIEIFYNDSINENYAVWDDKGEVKDHLL